MSKEDKKEDKVFPNFDATRDLSISTQPGRAKHGIGFKPLTEWEIKQAQSKARSAAEASRILGVSYNTYAKYAKEYGIFDDLKNPDGVGISKGQRYTQNRKYSIDDLLQGKYPDYPVHKLKKVIIDNGYMEEQCSLCGYNERRITDHKVALVLDFIDGDRRNHKFENLRFLCHNCSFNVNGNLTGSRKEYNW